jgi:hypothetical protein
MQHRWADEEHTALYMYKARYVQNICRFIYHLSIKKTLFEMVALVTWMRNLPNLVPPCSLTCNVNDPSPAPSSWCQQTRPFGSTCISGTQTSKR